MLQVEPEDQRQGNGKGKIKKSRRRVKGVIKWGGR